MSPQPAPIVLHLYDENDEVKKTCTRITIRWKMLKKSIALYKQFGSKEIEQYEDADIDALTSYIIEVFGDPELTVEMLDEMADIPEMTAVLLSVVSRAKGIMDPTLPPAPK